MTKALCHHVFVCENRRAEDHPRGCCASLDGVTVRQTLKALVMSEGLRETVRINRAGCLDRCEEGATLVIYPEGVWYGGVRPEDCGEIFDSHLKAGQPVERLLINRPIGETVES